MIFAGCERFGICMGKFLFFDFLWLFFKWNFLDRKQNDGFVKYLVCFPLMFVYLLPVFKKGFLEKSRNKAETFSQPAKIIKIKGIS